MVTYNKKNIKTFDIPNLFNRKFILILAFILLAELFSLFGYLLPASLSQGGFDFNKIGFFIIVILTLIASLIKLEYGLWILFTELFIGSKGYLFFFEHQGIIISIRIALWLVVMAVWFVRVVSGWLKKKPRLNFNFFQCNQCNQWFYFFILFIFIIWGVINGFLNHNEFNNIFFDFNGWLYFTLVFPVYSVLINRQGPFRNTLTRRGSIQGDAEIHNQHFDITKYQSEQITQRQYYDTTKYQSGVHATDSPVNTILQIFTASIIWLSAKTFFLLFAFSHNMIGMTSELYRWVRVSGVGEITQMQGGFYRIFFQSHIFVLIGLFVFLMLCADRQSPIAPPLKLWAARGRETLTKQRGKLINYYLLLITILFSVILISFSRSFWVGLFIGLLFYYFIILLFYKIGWRKFITTNAILLLSAILSIALIIGTVKFPYPKPAGGFATTELLSERASQITGEAGVSSRWTLLPELWNKIKQAPILGQGFGATVTYQSSDPRVLQSSPDGEYTTYAFEWGWLDVWLKLGFLGMAAYLFLLYKICVKGLMQNEKVKMNNDNEKCKIILGLIVGLVVISVVSIFSPYMNHPLGIGYIVLISAILDKVNA